MGNVKVKWSESRRFHRYLEDIPGNHSSEEFEESAVLCLYFILLNSFSTAVFQWMRYGRKINIWLAHFGVLVPVTMTGILRLIVDIYRCFEGTYWFYFQGRLCLNVWLFGTDMRQNNLDFFQGSLVSEDRNARNKLNFKLPVPQPALYRKPHEHKSCHLGYTLHWAQGGL
jgi:hypothetical protein